ncbi:MAG: hypothetical protein LBJ63_08105 [Prevotellaceae bacterium]|jgi:hypothetical protein|nr:hypothetical protein [Prevotellaceae bacterium]
MNNELNPKEYIIDRETKIMLLKALKRGKFTDTDIDFMRNKFNAISEIKIGFTDYRKIGYGD